MSNTPPLDPAGNPRGDGEAVSVVGARGAQRTGRAIWILAISLGLAVVLMLGYVALHAGHMQTINHPAGRDLNTADANSFNTPEPSPRQAPPGEPSTTGGAAH
jgi:hypothetical protein